MSDGNFKWWRAGFEDSEAWYGPHDTRDQAIAAGKADYGEDNFWICEADKAEFNFTGLFDGDFDGDLARDKQKIDADFVLTIWAETDEGIGEDGWDDGDFSEEDIAVLDAALKAAQLTPSPSPDTTSPRADALSKAFANWAEPRRKKFGDVYMFGKVRVSEQIAGKGEDDTDA